MLCSGTFPDAANSFLFLSRLSIKSAPAWARTPRRQPFNQGNSKYHGLAEEKTAAQKKAADEQRKAADDLKKASDEMKKALQEARNLTPEERKDYIRNGILIVISASFIVLVFLRVLVAYEGASTATTTAVDTGLALMTGYFGAVLYYLGIKQGTNSGSDASGHK